MSIGDTSYTPNKKWIVFYALILALFAPVWRPLCFDVCSWELLPWGGLWTLIIGQHVLLFYWLFFSLSLIMIGIRTWSNRKNFFLSLLLASAVLIVIIDIIVPTIVIPEIRKKAQLRQADAFDQTILARYKKNFEKINFGMNKLAVQNMTEGGANAVYNTLKIPKLDLPNKQNWTVRQPSTYNSMMFLDDPSYQIFKTYTKIYDETDGEEGEKQRTARAAVMPNISKTTVHIQRGLNYTFSIDKEIPNLLDQYFNARPDAVIRFDVCEHFVERILCFKNDRLIFFGVGDIYLSTRQSGDVIINIPGKARLDISYIKELIRNPET